MFILVSPIGHKNHELADGICEEISRVFKSSTRVSPILSDISFAYHSERDQYYSTVILDRISSSAPEEAQKVLAITEKDLFIPILTHVYGEAQLGGKACIVSTHRLGEGLLGMGRPDEFRRRVIKEAIHELGHTFKLRHCREQTCIMHYCRTVEDVDRKSLQLCRYCRVLLGDELRRLTGG